jgi:hypothetical protein
MSFEPTRPLPTGWPSQPATSGGRRRRRRRWPVITAITVIVVLALLAVADRVANAIAENQMASQIQSSGFPAKPNVTIQGFPFFTQLLAKDFKTVDISASNVTEGPLVIASVQATLHGMHINGSFSGATIDSITGSALVGFTALANAGGVPQGVTLTADGAHQVKANVNIGPISDTAVAQITQSGTSQINVKVVDAGGVPTSLLGNLANFTVTVPKLPAGMVIQSVSVTQQGVLITIAGHNTTLSK